MSFELPDVSWSTLIGFILLGLLVYFMSRQKKRPNRFLSSAGFEAEMPGESEASQMAEAMVGLPAIAVHRGQRDGRTLWVIDHDSGSSSDPNMTLLLYDLETSDHPALAAFQARANLPRFLGAVPGGFWNWLDPVGDPAFEGMTGKGWQLYAEQGRLQGPEPAGGVAAITRLPEAPFLLAITVKGRYLGLCASRFYLRQLLASGGKALAALNRD